MQYYCFWGLRPEQWNCLKFNHHSVCSQPFNLLLGLTFERLYRFWRMIQFWHCQENTHLHELLHHCSLKGYWAIACLVKFLDTVAMCSQERINLSLMLCKWKNFDPTYLQNLSSDFFKILQITATGHRLNISENISKGNPILLQQEWIEGVLKLAESIQRESTNLRISPPRIDCHLWCTQLLLLHHMLLPVIRHFRHITVGSPSKPETLAIKEQQFSGLNNDFFNNLTLFKGFQLNINSVS